MRLHEIPAIAAGLDHLAAAHPLFAAAERDRFPWERHDAGFPGLLRTILGQQVSTRAADAMWSKLKLLMPEPEPARFLALGDPELAGAGFSRQKMRYGRVIAETLIADPRYLSRLDEMDDDAVIATLIQLPGIGRWSAEVYLMFCLGRPDVWPVGDLGIVLGAQYLFGLAEKPTPDRVMAMAEAWRPHRTAASLLVWDHYIAVAADRRREQRAAAKGSLG
jgi:DNA-3-methyladenine glycosylase II